MPILEDYDDQKGCESPRSAADVRDEDNQAAPLPSGVTSNGSGA
jgi:hypothetical protein